MPLHKRTVFLDLDGVIINWIGGAIDWFGLNKEHWEMDVYNKIITETGLSINEFWKELNTPDFWEELQMYRGAWDILNMLSRLPVDVCLLTAPVWHAAGWRQNWIQENLPWYFYNRRYLIGPAKEFCAQPFAYLIDDADKNVEEFNEAGGMGILYPQPWNKNRDIKVNDRLDYITKQLM